jgi:hypothetical protein
MVAQTASGISAAAANGAGGFNGMILINERNQGFVMIRRFAADGQLAVFDDNLNPSLRHA